MAKGLLEEKSLQDIADAIRVKNGQSEAKYKPADMASAIMELKLGGNVIVSNEVSEVYILDGETTINVPKTGDAPEEGDYIIAQTKNGNDYDAAVFKVESVDKDSDSDNYVCSVKVSDTLDVIGVDTSDATALAADIMKGKTAYIGNEKVEGTLEALTTKELSTTNVVAGKAEDTDTENNVLKVILQNDLSNTEVINSTTTLATKVPFGDIATTLNIKASDIVTGKTVLGVEGAGGASGGVDTSDANATADNIEKNKTAYVDGAKVTGTLEALTGANESDTCTTAVNDTKDGIEVKLGKTDKVILNSSATLKGTVSFADLVTALDEGGAKVEAGDIAQGKTVLGISGTFTSDADAVASNIEKGKTAYVNGAKITGTLESITDAVATDTITVDEDNDKITLTSAALTENKIVKDNVEMEVLISALATELGLTADKIAKGVTILGIEGTFEATEEKEDEITSLTAERDALQAQLDSYKDLDNEEF